MWDELEAYRTITTFSCTIPCSCDALGSVRKYQEQNYVIRFLKGLDEKFTQSKTHIMMMNPLSNINRAFALIIQQERELNSSQSAISNSTGSEESTALHLNAAFGHNSSKTRNNSFKGKSKGYGGNKSHSRVCTHYANTTTQLRHVFSNMDTLVSLEVKENPLLLMLNLNMWLL